MRMMWSVSSWQRAMSTFVAALLAGSSTLACGPEAVEHGDWMLGTFSLTGAEHVVTGSTTRYVIHEDQVLELVDIHGCGANREELVDEYPWKHNEGDSIDVYEPGGGRYDFMGVQAWRLRETDDCNRLEVEEIRDGRVVGELPFFRGAICMEDLPPCEPGRECDSCKTVWCDEPPAPCDEQ